LLFPTKTTSTAAYAAVAPSNSNCEAPLPTSSDPTTSNSERGITATDTVTKLVVYDLCNAMISMGPIR
jgi:hypothetical protein